MFTKLNRRRWIAISAASAALVAGGAVAANAAIDRTDGFNQYGTVYACSTKAYDNVRVVPATTNGKPTVCKANEFPIKWDGKSKVGEQGKPGESAFQVAARNGYDGTEAEWLVSLKGADGKDGQDGAAGDKGQDGTNGSDGKSAYEVAVAAGFQGTEAEWLESLKGAKGDQGEAGPEGPAGPAGDKGKDGANGVSGYETVVNDKLTFSGGGWADAKCPEGKVALGGGYDIRDEANLTAGTAIVSSLPGRMNWDTNRPEGNTGWSIRVNKPANLNPGQIDIYVVCAAA